MAIYELMKHTIRSIEETTFAKLGINERADLQRLLRTQIGTISPDLLVIAEEFGEWDDSKRRIDLLALDKDANLVVIELKRTEDGGHMELQAIRYAAMVSAMTFERAVEVYAAYLQNIGSNLDARTSLLDFLGWDEANEDDFAQDVRIILVSADFSKELTTAVMWLNDRDLDIRCVRIKPYLDNGKVLIDVQQVIPLPEAAAYQVQLREKEKQVRKDRKGKKTVWPDWDSALAGIPNTAVVSYFKQELAAGRSSYLRKRVLRYKVKNKRAWSLTARNNNAYVWQGGRFENDIEFWRNGLSHPDEVGPVKDGASLRFSLYSEKDFKFFHEAATGRLQSMTWLNSSPDNDPEVQDAEDEGQA